MTLLDRFEQYLEEEADELTAEKWMPIARDAVPQADEMPGRDVFLDALLEPLRQQGMTPPAMQWAAWEQKRAEQKGLGTASEWLGDLLPRLMGDQMARRALKALRQNPPFDLGSELTLQDFLTVRRTIDRVLGGDATIAQLSEQARLHEGLPGRN